MGWVWPFRHAIRRRDLLREVEAHQAERADELADLGLSPEEARRRSRVEFGNPTAVVERSQDVWFSARLDRTWQDVRCAGRALRRLPFLTTGIVLVLAIGIGPSTALFLLTSATMLRQWPVPDPHSIAVVTTRNPRARDGSVSHPEYRYLREHATQFASLAVSIRGGGLVGEGVDSRMVQTNFVTANYFETLGIGMALGRGFMPSDEDYQAPPLVVVISHRLWRDTFGADVNLIGRTIRVYQRPMTIVGVAPRGFNDVQGAIGVDAWLPLPAYAVQFPESGRVLADVHGSVGVVIGRLRSGVTRAQGMAELSVLSGQFRVGAGLPPLTLAGTSTRRIDADWNTALSNLPVLTLLGGGLLLVLLVACANAGNLVLARTLARQRELAIRLSLGSSRTRLVRQLLLEAAILAGLAGTLGLLCATLLVQWFASNSLTGVNRNGAPPEGYFLPDASVFGFVALVSVFACVICSVGPAWRIARQNLHGVAGNRHGVTLGGHRLRSVLLGLQIALSIVLLTGAGLFTRAVEHAPDADPGFALEGVDLVAIRWPQNRTPTATPTQVARQLIANDLGQVALCDFSPFNTGAQFGSFHAQGASPGTGQFLIRGVSANYFSVLGIPLVAGRSFAEGAGRGEVVVSESVARLFPNGSAVGQYLVSRAGDRREPQILHLQGGVGLDGRAIGSARTTEPVQVLHQIVGVAKDSAVRALGQVEPVVYWAPDGGNVLLVRRHATATLQQVRSVVDSLTPGATIAAQPLKELMLDGLGGLRLASYVAWVIGLIALVLATVGTLGAFLFLVEERRREFAVRLALGATTGPVVRAVLSTIKGALLGGSAVGVCLSLVTAPFLRSWLYGLSPLDPAAYWRSLAVLALATVVATWLPVRRAKALDPVSVLKVD